MKLYLDDDSAKASLVKLLKNAGHQVAIPADAGLTGVSDPRADTDFPKYLPPNMEAEPQLVV